MSEDTSDNNDKVNKGDSCSINIGDKEKEVIEAVNENSHIIKQFQRYAIELDLKNDRYERIVKINRDITIESKRIIFLLHTLDKEDKKKSILEKAGTRIDNLVNKLFKNIALELENQDPYLYLRAYRIGLQEFIEAISFYYYLQNKTLCNWTDIEESMTYTIKESSEIDDDQSLANEKIVRTVVPPIEFVLGVADLTGELMRKCINNLGSGDISSCFETCEFVRNIYKGFLSCDGLYTPEVNRKMYVLHQSLLKMENVCYTIKVRGSEIPRHMLADAAMIASENINENIDEGYHVY